MPRYQCPECDAVLKREQPIPAGKKIKCPKCEFIFAAKSLEESESEKKPSKPKAEKKPAPVAAEKKSSDGDDDDDSPYVVTTDEEKDDKPELYFGSLRDKYAKSKRGPAMAMTTTPSNVLIGEGLLTCIGGIAFLVISIFPLVFSKEPLTEKVIREQVVKIIIAIVIFLWGAMVCYGASKLQNLDSYRWAMVGACMGIVPLLGGILAIVVMRKEEVIEGFEETAELKRKREIEQ
jgi:uncharacterized Zn finger protein (UPF0148 family)